METVCISFLNPVNSFLSRTSLEYSFPRLLSVQKQNIAVNLKAKKRNYEETYTLFPNLKWPYFEKSQTQQCRAGVGKLLPMGHIQSTAVFVNKVLLQHGHIHLLMYCSGWFCCLFVGFVFCFFGTRD